MKTDNTIFIKGHLRILSIINGEIYLPHCRHVKNIVTNLGFNLAAEALGVGYYEFRPLYVPSDPTVRGPDNRLVQYCAVGDDDTTPLITDSLLGNEQDRLAVTDALRESNVVYFDTFFGNDDANFTIKEAGLFGYNATATVNTGWLFSRTVDFSPIVKTTAETLTFSWGITLTSQ